MKKTVFTIFVAALLWFLMFSPWTAPYLNFWFSMSISASVLIFLSLFIDKKSILAQFSFNVKDVCIGLASAVVLWFVFYVGDYISSLIFDFSKTQVAGIYSLKDKGNSLIIGVLLLFLIGPAEEIFWRGFIQKRLGDKYGEWIAFFATTLIYALAHIWAFNFMLIMAALVCGGFWGLLYKWNKNLLTLVISHAVWDVAVFILFPIK
jgi:membrane protease YdiL (CAAX protease family)